MIKKTIAFIQQWGIGRTIIHITYAKFLSPLGFYITQVRGSEVVTSFEIDTAPGIVLKVISKDELLQLAQDPRLDMSKDFINFAFEQNYLPFGLLMDGKLVAYAWQSRSSVWLREDIFVEFPVEYRYGYKAFVLPEFRGQKLISLIYHFQANYYLELGISKVIGYIEINNFASFASGEAYGKSNKTLKRMDLGYAGYWSKGPFFLAFRTPAAKAAGFRFSRVKGHQPLL